MTDIEQKALALVNEVQDDWYQSYTEANVHELFKALCRAIEAHEADKARHAAEMREQAERFSEAVEGWLAKWTKCTPSRDECRHHFARFILPAADPLAECFAEIGWSTESPNGYRPDRLRKALADRGLQVGPIPE